MRDLDTIFAFGSGQGVSAIAVLRVSGDQCQTVMDRVLRKTLTPRNAHFCSFHNPSDGTVLDNGLALWFPEGSSATGENCLELHCHGGLAVKSALLDAISSIGGCRLAEPGEFTRRAFFNGKMDLIGVEGLADLLEARTERQRAQAFSVMGGAWCSHVKIWREGILGALSSLEVVLDFADEGDSPLEYRDKVQEFCNAVIRDLDSVLQQSRGGEVVREGYRVGICGRPNAGKSSLLNFLAKRDAAIVSDIAGTTRDIVEVSLNLDGFLVILADTAGIRDSLDSVERVGVDRARLLASECDLVLWLWDEEGFDNVDPMISECGTDIVKIRSKIDLSSGSCLGVGALGISVKSGEGADQLIQLIGSRIVSVSQGENSGLVTRARQKELIEKAIRSLNGVVALVDIEEPELLSERLRDASRFIGALTGEIHFEDVLGDIFARFCIGK